MERSSAGRLVSDVRRLLEGQHPLSCCEPLTCCDACLALQFGVSLEEAAEAASKLAIEPGFQRRPAKCEMCKRTLEITSLAPKIRR